MSLNLQPDLAIQDLDQFPRIPIESYEEFHVYGASLAISKLCGIESPKPAKVTWQHGWLFEPITHPKIAIGSSPHDYTRFVANQNIKAIIQSNFDRPNTYATGLPFIYADINSVSKLPNSILICPPHSLPWTDHCWTQHEYRDFVLELRKTFTTVAACVSKSCFEKKLWLDIFRDSGIPVIVGADSSDANSLYRMQRIFRSFEYMTTGCLGSHIPYAAYCGCKVSISGPFFEFRSEDFAKDPFYRENPDVLEAEIYRSSKRFALENYPFLFSNPGQATELKNWADEQLGVRHKLNAKQFANILGWDINPSKQSTKRHESVLLRSALRYLFRKAD